MIIVRVEVIVRVRVKSFKVFRFKVVEVVGLVVGLLWFWVVFLRLIRVVMVVGVSGISFMAKMHSSSIYKVAVSGSPRL